MTFDYQSRLIALRNLMNQAEIDAVLASVGADLPYLTGYRAMPLERLTMLVMVGDRVPVLIVPELEAPRVEPQPGIFVLRAWAETEDPFALVAQLLSDTRTVAIGEQTWSGFLLELQKRLPEARFEISAPFTRQLRMRKDDAELDALRRAAHAVDRVVERLREVRFTGRTEIELSRMVAEMTIEEGHEVASFAIVASGPNGASPHHEAGDRIVEDGDAIVVDFGGTVDGYGSDTTRNFSVGEPSAEYRRAFSVLDEAQSAAVAAVRPGVPAQDVDRAARRVIEAAGYGDSFIHRTGHGIGLDAHEHPYIVEGNQIALEQGMTFSIEPGIYLPGRFGMRIEDIVAVTEDGVERLNQSPRELILVD